MLGGMLLVPYLWACAADFADVAVVDLGRLGRLLGLQLLVLEGHLFGEGAACPGGRGCGSRHRLLLLLLLLLLLVVGRGSRVDSGLVARV